MPIASMTGEASSSSVTSSSSGNRKDLLSRISGPSPNMPATTNGRARKRRASDIDEEEEKRRRRVRTNEHNPHDPEAPWMSQVLEPEIVAKQPGDAMIHDELCEFVDYIAPSANERKARQFLVNCIETILRKRWSDVHVLVFGSNATGLELTGGDIDLVVSFDSVPNFSDSARKSRLAAMGDAVRKAGVTSWVNRIFGARVPIITFATTPDLGEFSVDISVRNSEDSGARAIPVIKRYIEETPLLRPLIIIVKAFLSLRDLNDASQNTLSSYAITLLCISFLQRNPARREDSMLNQPYEKKSIGTLLMDFFRHYGHDFSYATHYVSVSGRNIFTKKSNNWDLNPLSPAVLAVQCVLNSGNNITKGCTRIDEIVEAFKEGLHLLQVAPTNWIEEKKSVLNGLFVIPEEDRRRREDLEASVDSGAFARAAAACSSSLPPTNLGSSGGVFLGPRGAPARHTQGNGFQRNGYSQSNMMNAPLVSGNTRSSNHSTVHSGVAKHATPEILPILRWENDRSNNHHRRPSQHIHDKQFDFTFGQQTQGMMNPMIAANLFSTTVGPILNPYNQVNQGYEYMRQQFVSNNYPSQQRRRGGR